MNIIRADISHIDRLAELFDQYRCFYRQPTDIELAKQFLTERITQADSIIFIMLDQQHHYVGFAQIYLSFSSIQANQVFILNDLYIVEALRGQGYGKKLIEKVHELAIEKQVSYVVLQTEKSNTSAQKLYQQYGYEQESDFYTYVKMIA